MTKPKTAAKRLDELEPVVLDLKGIIDVLQREVAGIGDEQQQTASSIQTFKTLLDDLILKVTLLLEWKSSIGSFADLTAEIAVLRERTEDLKKRSEEWGRKLWMIVPPLIAVIVTFLLTYFFIKK
jgi:hypothetical protein